MCVFGVLQQPSLLDLSSTTTWPLPEAERSEGGGGLYTDGLIIVPTSDVCADGGFRLSEFLLRLLVQL